MSNIKHLDMCADVMALPEIAVKKTCFGLKTSVTYTPTGSPVKVRQSEYSPEMGHRWDLILNAEDDVAMELLKKYDFTTASMGKYRVDACISEDKQFAAVQLLHFTDFNYQPATAVRVFKGQLAEAISSCL